MGIKCENYWKNLFLSKVNIVLYKWEWIEKENYKFKDVLKRN